MFNKFTNKSQEAIINAQIIAQDSGQQFIDGLHILAALLQQSERTKQTQALIFSLHFIPPNQALGSNAHL